MNNPNESKLHMRSVLTATASALVTCFAFASPAWAQSNSIESITSAQQGSTTVLRSSPSTDRPGGRGATTTTTTSTCMPTTRPPAVGRCI